MKRWIFVAVVVLFAAALYVPRISAGSYRERAHAALEMTLHRKVKIGKVQFRLLPTPGLTISDVEIGEDPAVGSEPVAYVTTLVAVPRLKALFGGPLEFASVDLEETSLNLTRVDSPSTGVRWNFASLLEPRLLAAFPSIHMRGGRINFKFEDTKSLFYLLNTDVDLWPPDSAKGPWTLRIHAEPARTDRPARGFGSFVARGQWLPTDGSTTLDVKLEQSELGDMLTLFNGHETGINGHILGDAHLAGPLNRIGVAGRMTISNLHGWSQSPPGGGEWRFSVGGAINMPGQVIDLNASTKLAGTQAPLQIHYRVADYLGRPRWGVSANLNRFPLAPIPEIARNLGFPIPADFKFDGTADGAVGYSVPEGSPRMDGALNVSNSTLSVAGAPPLRLPNAELRFAGTSIRLEATEIRNDRNESAAIQGDWDIASQTFNAELSSYGMEIASLRRQISVAGIPLLSQVTSGTWKGDLHYSPAADEPGGWSGTISLADADLPFEAFAAPVHVVSADAMIDGAGLVMKHVNLTVGDVEAQGEYRYDSTATHPHRFRISVAPASGAALEKILMPTLRRGNFLTYAFNFGRVPEPDWLRNIRADGTIQTSALELGGAQFSKVRARVIWEGTKVEFAGLQGVFDDAAFTGGATVRLAGRQPAYQVQGKLSGLSWRDGTIDAEGLLATSGTGRNLFANMTAQGTFEGREIDLAALDSYDSVAGSFDWAWDARNPKLKLTQLVMKTGADTFLGTGEMGDNGQLVIRISDGTRHIQAAGAILRGDALKPVSP
ncbi:MAG TPA: hypothetical protein VK789_19990 [Bryobacteraceae bacterium]|jgi:hypothetical protein|nr:hypothetical protein [Bryobacteraceae bacterium]